MKWKKINKEEPHYGWRGYVHTIRPDQTIGSKIAEYWGGEKGFSIERRENHEVVFEWLDENEQDEGWVPVAKRLVELRPLHIVPYNLGDMGEIDGLIHKLAKLLAVTT